MASKKKFSSWDCEPNKVNIVDFINALTEISKKDPTAVISIRQCEGTDFPPFLAVESLEEYERMNQFGAYPCIC